MLKRWVGKHTSLKLPMYLNKWVDMIASGKPKEWAIKTLKIED
jgi:hypothetical protein